MKYDSGACSRPGRSRHAAKRISAAPFVRCTTPQEDTVRRFLERFRGKPPAGETPPAKPPVDQEEATTQLRTSSAGAVLGCLVLEAAPDSMQGRRITLHQRETRI